MDSSSQEEGLNHTLHDISNGATNIELSAVELNVLEAQSLAEALKANSTVTSVELNYNQLGDEGAANIADALKENSTITYIELTLNDVGDDGAASFAEALKMNSTLTVISIYMNKIGDLGAAFIAEALKENKMISHLSLNQNEIGDTGAASIAEALEVNCTVTDLALSDNKIGDTGARSIAKSLKENSSLKHLQLDGNPIGMYGILAVANAVKHGANALRYIMIGQQGKLKLLPTNGFLKYFNATGKVKFGKSLKASTFGSRIKQRKVLKIAYKQPSKDELYECLILQALPEHRNVVKLIGYVADIWRKDTKENGKLKVGRSKGERLVVVLAAEVHKNGSLKSYIEGQAVRELKPFLRFALGMSQAVKHLHDRNIIHRDIASRNFMLSDNDHPVLIDFRLSCYIKREPAVYQPGELFPFRHSAPETLYCAQSVKESDIWMLGVTFWQMLGINKGLPFHSYNSPRSLRAFLEKRFLSDQFEFPLFNSEDIHKDIKALISACCRPHYLHRPTINAVITKIEALQREQRSIEESERKKSPDELATEQYFREHAAIGGDLSVYAGGVYDPNEYVTNLEGDATTMEEYYNEVIRAGESSEDDSEDEEEDETDPNHDETD